MVRLREETLQSTARALDREKLKEYGFTYEPGKRWNNFNRSLFPALREGLAMMAGHAVQVEA